MILIFDPIPSVLRFCTIENNNLTESNCVFDSQWQTKILEIIPDQKKLDAIGYFIYHGGEEIKEPISTINNELLMKLEKIIGFLPESNDIIYKIAKHLFTFMPGVRHLLLCDTAFFIDLPTEASTYAVPFVLRKKGIRRYGGYGLCHQWAFQQINSPAGAQFKKVISIYLGDNTNIAAIMNGQPFETSIGFTPIEGILSSNGCGDLDPTIIFQLISNGFSLEDINNILSRESGFTGLMEEQTDYLSVIKNSEKPMKNFVKEVFKYNIQKYIGAFISILGGIDSIVFTSRYLDESIEFIMELCQSFSFLGLKCKVPSYRDSSIISIDDQNSSVKVFCLRYNKWEILKEKIISNN